MSSGNYLQVYHYLSRKLFWYDHFQGDSLDNRWNLLSVGGSGGAVQDLQLGGMYILYSHTDYNDYAEINWNNIRSLLVSKQVCAEARFYIPSNANAFYYFSLAYDANNRIFFYFDTDLGHVNWQGVCVSGGVSTYANSGIAATAVYHIFQIQTHTHGASHVHFFIDGVEVANSPVSTNVPNSYLQPTFRAGTRILGANKYMLIDYCMITQDR